MSRSREFDTRIGEKVTVYRKGTRSEEHVDVLSPGAGSRFPIAITAQSIAINLTRSEAKAVRKAIKRALA